MKPTSLNPKEARLLALARDGDTAAWDQLWALHKMACLSVIKSRLKLRDDVEDAMLLTELAAWKGLATFRFGSSMRPWILQISRRAIADVIRSKPDVPKHGVREIARSNTRSIHSDAEEAYIEPGFERVLIQQAMHTLWNELLEVLHYRYIGIFRLLMYGATIAEIAQMVDGDPRHMLYRAQQQARPIAVAHGF